MDVEKLGKYMKDLKSPEDINRFQRILRFYGLEAIDADMGRFLKMILDEPNEFKCSSRILKKWTKKKSVYDVFMSITRVCKLPEVKEYLGDRFDDIVNAHEQYVKELQDMVIIDNDNSDNGVVVRKAIVVGGAESDIYSENEEALEANCEHENEEINNKLSPQKIECFVKYMKYHSDNVTIAMFANMFIDESKEHDGIRVDRIMFIVELMRDYDDKPIITFIKLFEDACNNI